MAITAAEPPQHAMIDFVNGDSMVRDGRRGELRAVLVARIGATEAEQIIQGIAAPDPEKRAGPDESSEQGSLF